MTPARMADPNVAQDNASFEAPIVTDPNHAELFSLRAPRCRKCSGIRNTLTGLP